MTTAVTVLSVSSAYCFNCLTKFFGRSHVVLTFIESSVGLRCDIKIVLFTAIYTVIQKDLLLPYCRIYGMTTCICNLNVLGETVDTMCNYKKCYCKFLDDFQESLLTQRNYPSDTVVDLSFKSG